jgi:EmrB/QacA subfamily drug resistance transporter
MTTVAAPPGERPAERRAILLVVSGLMLVMLLASLDQTIVSTALPTIVGELGGLDHLSWVVTAYLLAVTVVTPLYGKLGDLYGRKIVLQVALALFLLGSALCGLAQGMSELIAFRAIQGLGGGGLMVSAQAAIGDVVPPRERGRWTGLFGAVFGVSSVAGPLIGGFLTTHVSWRWIFYVNLPLGLVALAVLAVTLPGARERIEHRIDYEGTALLAVALSAIVLATTLGGTSYDWDSAVIVGMGVLAVLALAGFAVAERRAPEPVLPPALFRNRVFVVTSAVGLVVGFALFGALTFLPLFQQVVRGDSPTESGLQLLPVMGGLLATSIVSGQVITRTGRYRMFPIAGTAVGVVGLGLLSTLDRDTSPVLAALYMLVLGAGLGMVMQVLVSPCRTPCPTSSSAWRRRARRCSGRSAVRSARRCWARCSRTASPTRWRVRARPAGRRPRTPGASTRRRSSACPRRPATPTSARSPTHSTSSSPPRPASCSSRSCLPGCCPSARCARACAPPACSRRSPRRRTPTRCARSPASSACSSAARA